MSRAIAARPLDPGRLLLHAATPFTRAIGVDILEWGGGRATTRVVPNARIARATNDPRPHPLVLPGIADDVLSHAFGCVVAPQQGLSTLDLWLGIDERDPDGSPIIATSQILSLAGTSGTASASIADGGGLLATATATFLIGQYPGGRGPDARLIGRYDATSSDGPLPSLLGLEGRPGTPAFASGNPAVIGWESGPSLHGGAIAALLMVACQGCGGLPDQRLGSVAVRFLRPCIGSALRAEAQLDRAGRQASHVSALAFSDAPKPAAMATATFVRRDG
ncbi:acyl-CoA thioesterase domain-containing protein [uncultured Sphingomonas sp.]|uniref:acyl-CoA thioesterase domain-containing protein n=1 Tax=uncultured Sphingomonas sp. TaxID=158754 RepID=UPI0035CA9850